MSRGATAWPVGAWVRNAVSPGALAYIVSRGAGTGCDLPQCLVFQVTNQTTYSSPDAGAGVWDGAWHHVLGTYDGVNVRQVRSALTTQPRATTGSISALMAAAARPALSVN